MSFKEHILELTEQAHKSVIKSARAVPVDKLEWKVNDAARTVLDMIQEIAKVPDYARQVVETLAAPPFDPEAYTAVIEERKQWKTLDQCEKEMNDRLRLFTNAVKVLPEEKLDVMIVLPFDPENQYSIANIIAHPYWNATYHLGQIGFIQTLYGDTKMHF